MSLGSLALLTAGPVSANGRFPAADQLVINPSDPTHIVARTTYGLMATHDNGKTWAWTCEELIGRLANLDPPLGVMGDGSIVVAVPFEGVSTSHDNGCTWEKSPAPLANQLAVDVTMVPNDPAHLVVLTSTNDTPADAGPQAPAEFLNLVAETKDNAKTWSLRGAPLPRDFIAATIEIAHSDPKRFYVSGVFGDPVQGAIERSEDGGQTWTRAVVPTPTNFGSVYISAVHPENPDRIYVRVTGQQDPTTLAVPTTLLMTNDKGDHWTELATTPDAMYGFALSPDGATLAYGTQKAGIFLGPADGSGAFENVTKIQDRCLTWTAAGLYACGMTPPDPFAIGLSGDRGRSFQTLYQLADTCPIECPSDGRFNQICRNSWAVSPGIAVTIGATGLACTVPWAHVDAGVGAPDGAAGGSIDSGTTTGGGAGAGGATSGGSGGAGGSTTTPSSDSCSCRLGASTRGTQSAPLAFTALMTTSIAYAARRRRTTRHRV